MFFGRAASGRRCPRTCRRSRRHITTSCWWDWDGTLERIHHALYVPVRDREGREASPSAAVIDSQSARERKKGGFARPAGLRCGQEGHDTLGRKRHILVDTLGLLLSVIVPSKALRRAGSRRRPRAASNRAPFVPLHERPSSPTAATRGRGWRRPSPRPAAGSWKSLSAPTRTASWPLPKRWIVERTATRLDQRPARATGASPATSSVMPEPLSPSSVSP